MKVLVPMHQLDFSGIGAVLRSTLRALGPLSKRHEIYIMGADTSRQLLGRFERVRFEQVSVPISARGFDVLHMSDHRAPLITRTPTILTIHDLFFIDHPEWFPSSVARYKRALFRSSLAGPIAAVIAASEFTALRFRELFPTYDRARVFVVHPSLVVARGATWRGVKSDYILTIAALQPRKNLLTLLRAFHEARAQGSKMRWVVVGRPGYLGGPVAQALSASPLVELHPFASAKRLDALIDGAALLASPSLAEGFGLPPLEAMARGTPVAVSWGSAYDEVVGDAGLRLPPLDVIGWRDMILRVEDDEPLLSTLSRAGRIQARRFNHARTANAMARVYESVEARLA